MILVIDDNPDVREYMQLVLPSAGLEVIVAPTGEEGIAQFKAHGTKIKVVLLDLEMPGMGGVAAFHHLRSLNANLPILIFSALDSAEIRDLFPQQPSLSILHKNHFGKQLLAILTKYIQPSACV